MPDSSTDSRGRRFAGDAVPAFAIFLALGAIYVATLLPGLGGTEDTPKFQYVGAALGTPHDPGYPLYMIACWAASKLPFGILAYRINLLSAFWGATAGALVFLAMRRVAVPRWIAACVALAGGLGRFFWQHSTFAEAYTQVSAFTAAAILALLIWDEDGRDRWLYAAVAATSLAFGTHLIIVGMVPAFAWFVLSRYRWRVPLRVLAVVSLIVVLGVAQYGYVWLRTVQHAQYLEARARSVGELFDTMRGRQFAGQTFRESPLVIARTRVPEVAGAARTELGWPGVVAGAAGVLALWQSRRRAAVMLAGAFLGSAALLAMLGRVATEGIQLPAIMPIWVLAGAGSAFVWVRAEALTGRTVRIAALAAAGLAVAALPVLQASGNYEFNDSSGDTYYTDYFKALFDSLDGPAAFLWEEYSIRHMLEYQAYATGTRGMINPNTREPAQARELLDRGVPVYVFRQGFDDLDGSVRVRPVTLTGIPLDDRLSRLRTGKIVVLAGLAPQWLSLRSLTLGTRERLTGRAIVISVKGVGPAIVTNPGFEGAVEIRAGEPLGQTGYVAPASLRVEAYGRRTSISVDGQTVVESAAGIAVAEIGSSVDARYVLRPETLFKAPIEMGRLPLYRVLALTPADSCAALTSGSWRRLANPGLEGQLVAHLDGDAPVGAAWVLYVAGAHPLSARVAGWSAPGDPVADVEAFEPARDADRLGRLLAADGLTDAADLLGAQHVTRLSIRVSASYGIAVFRVNLGSIPSLAWSRVVIDPPAERRARMCAGVALPLEPDAGTQRATVYLGAGGDWYFGDGWHNPDPVPAGYYRRADGPVAGLLLPIAQRSAITLRLSAEALNGARAVTPILNDRRLAEQALSAGWNDLAWLADASAWRAGVNELLLEIAGPTTAAAAGQAVPSLRVRRIALDWSGVQ